MWCSFDHVHPWDVWCSFDHVHPWDVWCSFDHVHPWDVTVGIRATKILYFFLLSIAPICHQLSLPLFIPQLGSIPIKSTTNPTKISIKFHFPFLTHHLFEEMAGHYDPTHSSVLQVTVTHLIYPVMEKVLCQLFDVFGVNDVCLL
jgi:hypothetical protein